MSSRIFLSLSLALPIASITLADDAGLDNVVVTATRTEIALDRVGDSITVITPEEVRRSQKAVVSDLISTTPGVTMSRNGGFGTVTSVRIRGAETDQTVVLLDGVKLNDPSTAGGGYNFGNLVVDDIARIEVLRGPQSTLWGSQAIGGVVNIVTPVPQGPLSGMLVGEAGANDFANVRARFESGGDRYGWRIGGNYLTTDGVSAFDEDLGGLEEDGYRNVGLNARGIYRFTDALSLDARATWSKGRSDFDGFPPPFYGFADTTEYGDTEELVAYAGLNLDLLGGRFKNRFAFAYTDTDRDNYDPTSSVAKTFEAIGENKRWEYQGTVAIADGYEAVFGLESETSALETASPSPFDPNPTPLDRDVQLDSVYAQLVASPIEALTLTAGVRRDDHDEFGGATTLRGAVAWSVGPSTTLRATYGEGFKAPTLYQLYSEYGNAALQPEEAEAWDAGIEQRLGDAVVVSATYFSRDTTNQIDFASCFGNPDPRCVAQPFGFYDNIAATVADGFELSATVNASDALRLSANYTRTDAENDVAGSALRGNQLVRRARDTANAELSYEWPIRLTTSVAAQYVGKRYENATNTLVLDSYTLVDLRVTYAISDEFDVFGRLENAFDENYESTRNYGSIGRAGYFGVRFKF